MGMTKNGKMIIKPTDITLDIPDGLMLPAPKPDGTTFKLVDGPDGNIKSIPDNVTVDDLEILVDNAGNAYLINRKLSKLVDDLMMSYGVDRDLAKQLVYLKDAQKLLDNVTLMTSINALSNKGDYNSEGIRRVVENLENLFEVLDVKLWELITDPAEKITFNQLKEGINTSLSKAEMIRQLKKVSAEGFDEKEFLEAFKAKGRAIEHEMNISFTNLPNTFDNLDPDKLDIDFPSTDFNNKWEIRQKADTKQKKIVASELLAEARVDQIYKSMNWVRIDKVIDDFISGKQGKFDRMYESPTGEIHVIEAKGGGSTLGARLTAANGVAQQGTIQYRIDIINNINEKLGINHSLVSKMQLAIDNEKLLYVLVRQKTDSKPKFIVKNFPE